ncbi:hypothetical protein M0805_000359 [Coniferiporia weirii]|nr:hypothetical protein M0805_000359 [Coniferiporia weirii]
MSSLLHPGASRSGKGRSSPLPSYSSAVHEKSFINGKLQSGFFTTLYVPIPGVPGRQLRAPVPIPPRLYHSTIARFGRRRGCLILFFGTLTVLWTIFAFAKRFGTEEKQWPTPFQSDTTLVFQRDDLRKIWEWEIASGHYPSSRKIPEQIGLMHEPLNPALPPLKRPTLPSRFRPPPKSTMTTTRGIGSKRVYLDIQAKPPNTAYPPRPVPGSVADLDVIMEHCDFSNNKFVRDCLEVLRLGGGLDNGNRVRRGSMDEWKYIYLEQGELQNYTIAERDEEPTYNPWAVEALPHDKSVEENPNAGLIKKHSVEWEPAVELPDPIEYHRSEVLPDACDPDHPRIYHMFWTGPFTDKPYLALLSYLFTQNLGLHEPAGHQEAKVCRPQFWMWINPGPAAAVPNTSARREMFDQLKSNPWASPFLHPRFKDVIQFKMWNTTEQLDGIPELKEEWRALQETLFNSGGHIIQVPQKKVTTTTTEEEQPETPANEAGDDLTAPPSPSTPVKADNDDMLNRLGSSSSSSYDRLSVILSDMARFVLCHRFGGIYLDADTILLRDWEELWGWKGAFAYRWSRLETYNTAVLHLNKGSALGTFLFRTALKNLLDFHPMTVSKYTKDSFMEGLLLRLPDALFDSAWLNTEYFQRDRPPQPYFTAFEDFFETPLQNSAAPQALGFEGFFRGAYSYHFHNFWWKPFDPSRDWPDLGPRFTKGEQLARERLKTTKVASTLDEEEEDSGDKVSDDKRDLDWATVLKRTFEGYIRGERPNMYGEWLQW